MRLYFPFLRDKKKPRVVSAVFENEEEKGKFFDLQEYAEETAGEEKLSQQVFILFFIAVNILGIDVKDLKTVDWNSRIDNPMDLGFWVGKVRNLVQDKKPDALKYFGSPNSGRWRVP